MKNENPIAGIGKPAVVLYLDFDGVLHPEDVWHKPGVGAYVRTPAGHSLFEHAELLETLLEPYPTVGIVLSTSWVVTLGYARARSYLPPRLKERVVGATYHSTMNPLEFRNLPRGEQVLGDVTRRRPKKWLAVDDTDDGWPSHFRENVVITDPVDGLSHQQCHSALRARLALAMAPK
ncbi:HAD domain-containing protein [Derxia gummosa]|uniref:HAD domain-containing protein n=1 Tax=Derxia gummosa DSM 723 TaxID=1121388 RepID=A0A8B6XBL9_9BURK|nr:HAD domain-containing protein [Derxia gummosa]